LVQGDPESEVSTGTLLVIFANIRAGFWTSDSHFDGYILQSIRQHGVISNRPRQDAELSFSGCIQQTPHRANGADVSSNFKLIPDLSNCKSA